MEDKPELRGRSTWTLEFLLKNTICVNKDVSCADVKTALARNKPTIPDGSIIEVINITTNMYGVWIEAIWNSTHYYINPNDICVRAGEKLEDTLIEHIKSKAEEMKVETKYYEALNKEGNKND